jgi:hypothetical protein
MRASRIKSEQIAKGLQQHLKLDIAQGGRIRLPIRSCDSTTL